MHTDEHGANGATRRATAALGALLGGHTSAAARAVAGLGSTTADLARLTDATRQLQTLVAAEVQERSEAEDEVRNAVLATVRPEDALRYVADARALHRPSPGLTNASECAYCRDEAGQLLSWPCPTAEALGCEPDD